MQSYHILLARLICAVIVLKTIASVGADELISKDSSSDTCSADGDSGCGGSIELHKKLKSWLDKTREKIFANECDLKLESSGEAVQVYQIVSCDEVGALWRYKYSGGKGPRKIFKGSGKLSFTNLLTPPHGYDYGMKSGICLKIDDQIRSIEGIFNNKGLPHGDGVVLFRNGTAIRGTLRHGAWHGLIRIFEDKIDPETNQPFPEKHLSLVATFINGRITGSVWRFLQNDAIIFDDGAETESKVLFVPHVDVIEEEEEKESDKLDFLKGYDEKEQEFLRRQINLTEVEANMKNNVDIDTKTSTQTSTKKPVKYFEEIMWGQIDEDDMINGAQEIEVTDVRVDPNTCMMSIKAVKKETTFDFDIRSKTRMSAPRTKLTRFFDVAADHSVSLTSRFQPLPAETLNTVASDKIFERLRPVDVSKNIYTLQCPYEHRKTVHVLYEGKYNDKGQFVGNSSLNFFSDVRKFSAPNGTDTPVQDVFFLYQDLMIPATSDRHVSQISGEFVDGKLKGFVKIQYFGGSYVEGFAVDNVLHGVFRRVIKVHSPRMLRKYYTSQVLAASDRKSQGKFAGDKPSSLFEVVNVGVFKNGRLSGPLWQMLIGGSFLFGNVNAKKAVDFDVLTSDSGAYISADFSQAYVGTLEDGLMLTSQNSAVLGVADIDQIRTPVLAQSSEQIYRYCPQPDGSFVDPLVPDPLEAEFVYVNDSTVCKDACQGLFAKKEIPADTVVAFFGGRIVSLDKWKEMKLFDPIYWRPVEESVVYLPDEIGKDLKKYSASLGHKINHKFRGFNCYFVAQFHPRFGIIPAAKVFNKLAKDAEIICNYDDSFDNGAPWYQELWRKELDSDIEEGPFGYRGSKKSAGEPISPMLVDSELYKSFVKHAIEDLKLEPVT